MMTIAREITIDLFFFVCGDCENEGFVSMQHQDIGRCAHGSEWPNSIVYQIEQLLKNTKSIDFIRAT